MVSNFVATTQVFERVAFCQRCLVLLLKGALKVGKLLRVQSFHKASTVRLVKDVAERNAKLKDRTVSLQSKGVAYATQVINFTNYCKLSDVPGDVQIARSGQDFDYVASMLRVSLSIAIVVNASPLPIGPLANQIV